MAGPVPLQITDEIAALIRGAYDSGNVLLLAAVDAQDRPILSFRGSTAVFSDTQLSFWARKRDGGTVEAIHRNPNVALVYRSRSVPALQFIGRAHIATDPAQSRRAYEIAHEKERAADPERRGCAILIELDEIRGVLGFDENGPRLCHMLRR